ncbi:unnamed protein product [Linum tenue]|uniref:BTB domain-containing protein n=1 Tax=Linum tenue TaxID=586396 RepID=A0AAV0R9U4_9ROSI|nr:unnamed protein product [Linum tenue]
MAEVKLTKVEPGHTKIRNVPIAVTPEGFWCCPSPVGFQKATKHQNPLNKTKPSSPPPKTTIPKKQSSHNNERRSQPPNPPRAAVASDDHQRSCGADAPAVSGSAGSDRGPRTKVENAPRKVAIEFGDPGTSDLKVILLGKQSFCVKLTAHRNVLVENSSFFAEKLSYGDSNLSYLEVNDCEDIEIYVETVGLMYCKEMKQRLIKQSLTRVLRILKAAELLGFSSCIQSCLEYLEAVPWVGEEEEEKVVSTVLRLQNEGFEVSPILKRVSSHASAPPKDTLPRIVELVLKSNEERGRREMKSVVLKLLRENNNNSNLPSYAAATDVCNETLYTSCASCLNSLLSLFNQASEPEFTDKPMENKEPVLKQIAFESDNLSWLLDILADRQAADQFAVMWAGQVELAALHASLTVSTRYHVSCITGRLFVGIGKGELLPSKDTRQSLLETWLQPLINDYSWLTHGCRSFDRKVVEEGIGRTILTLPLENQQSILLAWLGSFLKAGDNCPNLQRAFEVWWRRAFIRPYSETQGSDDIRLPQQPVDCAVISEQ